jgi:SprT protein
MTTLANFTALVKLCIEAAEAKYGKMPAIDIRYDLKGRAAGQAGCHRRFDGSAFNLFLRFNREAITKDWDTMVKQTIPHEVAHLVAYCFPRLGAKNHNWKWAEIDRSLGGTGERCHRMELTPGRKTTRYRYVLDSGQEISVGPKHHANLQRGAVMKLRKSGEALTKTHFKPI